ncbi:MAG TPA: signal peptide peptidase SppA [Elusimicrobiota bacterium]|jgi:protease-4|nr:signal peptide peptidase SppA [Elusimicrobiota bacterium]
MDELNPPNPSSQPSPVPGPAPEAHAPSPRRVKRRLLSWLLGLHALALLAALLLIVRSKGGANRGEGVGKSISLLSAAAPDTVGWISIRGPIYSSESDKPWEQGSEQVARHIEELAETKGVKAIVLDINSPGGSVGAVQEIYSRILRVKKDHPNLKFVASFGDVAASGGYYLASACDKIVAHPGTLTGSIGVIFDLTDLQGLFSKIGYKTEAIKSGKFKDMGSPARALTPEEHAILQALVEDAYGQFVQAVATGRKMTVAQVKVLADGRVYSGDQALANGLVDQLGDTQDALMLAARLGGITAAKPKVRRPGEKLGDIFEMLETRTRLSFGLGPVSIPLPDALSSQARGMLYMWAGR